MSDPGGVSAGEIGGIFAGLVALLAAIGKGAAWLLNWKEARANTRSAKLDAWQRELAERETSLDRTLADERAAIAARLSEIEAKYQALLRNNLDMVVRFERQRSAYRVLAAEVVRVSPHSEAIMAAQMILEEPLPVPPMPEVPALLAEIDAADGAAE